LQLDHQLRHCTSRADWSQEDRLQVLYCESHCNAQPLHNQRRVDLCSLQIFSLINASFVPVIYFFYPETKGLSLEAVDLLFSKDQAHHDLTEIKHDNVHVEGRVEDKAAELDDYHRVDRV